jgi:hypothetical protein
MSVVITDDEVGNVRNHDDTRPTRRRPGPAPKRPFMLFSADVIEKALSDGTRKPSSDELKRAWEELGDKQSVYNLKYGVAMVEYQEAW